MGESIDGRDSIPLGLGPVLALLSVLDVEWRPEQFEVAAAIRRRYALGESQASLAAAYGLSQFRVNAIVGNRLLVPTAGGRAGGLGSPDEARAWLAARGWWATTDELRESDMAVLREMKALLRAMALANNGEPLAPGMLVRLDELAANAPMVSSFAGDDGVRMVPAGGGILRVVALILAGVVEAMHNGTWPRVKACPGRGCPAAFYDSSPKASRTWCVMSVCGNRAKVRNYQERRRTAKGTAELAYRTLACHQVQEEWRP